MNGFNSTMKPLMSTFPHYYSRPMILSSDRYVFDIMIIEMKDTKIPFIKIVSKLIFIFGRIIEVK